MSSAAIDASIASSVFLVFVVPHSLASSPRRVMGGHLVGVIIGSAIWAISNGTIDKHGTFGSEALIFAAALAVGIAILMMAVTNTEHPPAAGTALGLVTVGSSFEAAGFILSAAAILTVIRILLLKRLTNLL